MEAFKIWLKNGNIGFEETFWKAADKLRGSMDASKYKHMVLGLQFLRHITGKFETKHEELVAEGEGLKKIVTSTKQRIFPGCRRKLGGHSLWIVPKMKRLASISTMP